MVKYYKQIDINDNNIDGYKQIFNAFNKKEKKIFKTLFWVLGSAMFISIPFNSLGIATMSLSIAVIFRYMDLVFSNRKYLPKKCHKELEKIKEEYPSIDTDICYNELEYQLKIYLEKERTLLKKKLNDEMNIIEAENNKQKENENNLEDDFMTIEDFDSRTNIDNMMLNDYPDVIVEGNDSIEENYSCKVKSLGTMKHD